MFGVFLAFAGKMCYDAQESTPMTGRNMNGNIEGGKRYAA